MEPEIASKFLALKEEITKEPPNYENVTKRWWDFSVMECLKAQALIPEHALFHAFVACGAIQTIMEFAAMTVADDIKVSLDVLELDRRPH